MTIQLKNKHTGGIEEAPTGFSWTSAFFGGLVPIIRGDWRTFFAHTVLCILTLGLYHIFFCINYNKKYIKKLIMTGHVPANEQAETYLKLNGLYLDPNN